MGFWNSTSGFCWRRVGWAAAVVWLLAMGLSCAIGDAALPGAPRPIDAKRIAAAGLRIIDSRHLRLVTDLPSSVAVDELPAVFDAAVPEWTKYFKLPAASIEGKWLAFL